MNRLRQIQLSSIIAQPTSSQDHGHGNFICVFDPRADEDERAGKGTIILQLLQETQVTSSLTALSVDADAVQTAL
jgi:hypothetical protein